MICKRGLRHPPCNGRITSKAMPAIGKLHALAYRSGFAFTTTSAISPVPLSLTAASISEELHTTNQVHFIRPH